MSQRGSFVTEYIYCRECFKAIKPILLQNEKHFIGNIITGIERGLFFFKRHIEQPIIAGRLGSSYFGGEVIALDTDIAPRLAEVICHPIRIVVIGEDCEPETFLIEPSEGKKRRGNK